MAIYQIRVKEEAVRFMHVEAQDAETARKQAQELIDRLSHVVLVYDAMDEEATIDGEPELVKEPEPADLKNAEENAEAYEELQEEND